MNELFDFPTQSLSIQSGKEIMEQLQTPELGFYYHYKHAPNGTVNNYAYEVIGTALHTEERNYTVIYRPLYKNTFLEGANFCARPLEMWNENVTKEDKTFPRFERITDPAVIAHLEQIKTEMYDK